MNIVILSQLNNYTTHRLRAEGKALGHSVRVIDPLNLTVKVGLAAEKKIADFVIARIGVPLHFYGIAVLRSFELRMPVFNSALSFELSRNKLTSQQILEKAGIPTPPAVYFNKYKRTPQIGVYKELMGSQGKEVYLAKTKKEGQALLQKLKNKDYLVQKFVKESMGKDYRLFVVNGKVIASMKRQGSPGEFRSNLHQGGTALEWTPDKTMKSLAINTCKALGLFMAGVDIIQSHQGPLVLEANPCPGFEGLEKLSGVNIAGKIIQEAVAYSLETSTQKPHFQPSF